MHRSSKRFGPFSACFRNWRAKSHCNQLHGYGLTFTFTFEAEELDDRGWVIDFGGLKDVKQALEDRFDHRLIVAEDDPHFDRIMVLRELRLANVLMLPQIGCEAFANLAAEIGRHWLHAYGHTPRVRLVQVECREHENNAGYWVAS